jgi:hypothetical protein
VRDGSALFINCTITANSALGGGPGAGRTTGVAGVGTAGGAYRENGGVTLVNTIVAGNTAGNASPDLAGSFLSSGFNLVGDNQGTAGLSVNDYQNEPAKIGPLQDNGGPTFTHALLNGSLAIGGGTTTGMPMTDQRGVPDRAGHYRAPPTPQPSNCWRITGTEYRGRCRWPVPAGIMRGVDARCLDESHRPAVAVKLVYVPGFHLWKCSNALLSPHGAIIRRTPMQFDSLQVAAWIRLQVVLDGILDPTTAAEMEAHCLALARTGLPQCYRFAERSQLFWRGITRGNRNATAAVGDEDFDAKKFILEAGEKHYHPLLKRFLLDNGITLSPPFPITPEEIAFALAGGGSLQRPDGGLWSLTHLYDGRHPFEERATTLNAYNEGDHFTESAGLVAVSPACGDYLESGCVVKTLRWVAFEEFSYDPDHYFNADSDAHDQFGFVGRSRRGPIIL